MSNPDPVIEKIIVARVGLLLRHPFFGNLATRLKIQEGWESLTTAATDGKAIYFNRKFFNSLTVKNVEFVLAHEILHNCFDHFGRKEYRDGYIFNAAADYCINGQLVRDKIGESPKDIKIFHDTKYYGMSAEEVYEQIYEKMDEYQLKALGQLLDEHIDWETADGDRPVHTKESLREIRDGLREAMLQAAKAAGAGNTPSEISRLIKDLTEHKMNWREILRQQIQSTIKNDYSFLRPNRKGWHMNAILPGTNFANTIDICVALDMSGSIGDVEAKDFLSEVKGIMEEFQEFNLKLWSFDTAVYNQVDFNSYNVEEFYDYTPIGGGGTNFEANWKYMKEHDIQPKKFIMFTDMMPYGSWGDPDYCDTIFIAHGAPTVEAPFGITCHYEK